MGSKTRKKVKGEKMMRKRKQLFLGLMIMVFGCNNDQSQEERPQIGEYVCIGNYKEEDLTDYELSFFDYSLEDVTRIVVGRWEGTFPGNKYVSESSLTVEIKEFKEQTVEYTIPVPTNNYENVKAGEDEYEICGEMLIPLELTIKSSSEELSISKEDYGFIAVIGIHLAGSLSKNEITGVPLYTKEIKDEGKDGHREYYIVFQENGKMFVSFEKDEKRNFIESGIKVQ